ncbi:MAG TPA: BON domain-containing protein [Polyangiaceae bacterium]|jgi:osmotically-inducible protein OsmY|nr:BON domain-containing protein [Polyangiaceae bacterium]
MSHRSGPAHDATDLCSQTETAERLRDEEIDEAGRTPLERGNAGIHKTNAQLKQEVEEELRWDLKVNAAQIEVSVDGGSVSLRGSVDTFGEKWAAEDVARRVNGVGAVVHDLSVKLLGEHVRKDSDIAIAIRNTLSWDVFVPRGLTARVQNGAVSLGGQVDWTYQRDAAERAIRNLTGVVSVHNAIVLRKPSMTPGERPTGFWPRRSGGR